jgi:hypothetical protein
MKKSIIMIDEQRINTDLVAITSIAINTNRGSLIIPVSPETPLPCADAETLRSIARQMESLIRILARAGDGRLPMQGDKEPDEKCAVVVW